MQTLKPKMTEEEFHRFRDLIYQRTHIYCADAQKPLFERKISGRVTQLNLSSFHDYYALLRHQDHDEEEMTRLIDSIAVHETSFFRIQPHFSALREYVLPRLLETVDTLKIWSAGCSTGEEPYSIAITIAHFLASRFPSYNMRNTVKILASDISAAVIEKARQGRYSEQQFRTVPQPFRDTYFTREGKCYQIIDSIKHLISFHVWNLIHPEHIAETRFHVIFCRNVLIYFDRMAQETLLHQLLDRLVPGGYLFLGDAEATHLFPEITKRVTLINLTNAIIYQKNGEVS